MPEVENPIIVAKKKSRTLTSGSKTKKEKSIKRKSTPTSNSSSSSDVKSWKEDRDSETEHHPSSSKETTNPVNDISESRPSKKRKIIPDEIEVDITAPEPPSKKELRLLKKNKSLPSTKIGVDLAGHNNIKTKELNPKKGSDHGIWIGNLQYQISTDDIHKFLVDNSEISDEMITRIHLPEMQVIKSTQNAVTKDEKKAYNKGFAYVDFSCVEAVGLAVALSEKLLHGRRLLIKDKKSFEGRPKKVKTESEKNDEPQTKRIFLGNLSFDTTEEDLKEHFKKCGTIKSLKIATFEDSGKCKGFAWIVFEEFQAARDAVRGFIIISDTVDASNSESMSEEDHSKSSSFKQGAKGIQRKVWVNRIKGRRLRVEFAEDAQLRYKKRYGKDGTKNLGDTAKVTQGSIVGDLVKPLKKVEYRQEYAPRLTGGIIESKGKKITF
ncbi:Nucleolar protein 13 [Erysiphe neolycopersici]|uniref:Nucleolar protein 13 n=1 Tax=Erysiphe neolycopersici TaxID=212602 RepID=A0A420HFC9_9PEZI|nr:Nucleolar protein 13 [Erysiphe neolycopersici]